MTDRDAPTYPHAADPPLWWCVGHYDPEPIRHVGANHAAAPPGGWPVYRCRDCGAELFHAPRTKYEDDKIRLLAESAARPP